MGLAIAACGAKAVDRSAPQPVVDAWFAAAKAGDKAAMLEVLDAKAKDHETTHERAFTNVIGSGKIKLVTFEPKGPMETTGDEAKIRYKAKFVDEHGKEDGEGMYFELAKNGDGWWVTAIH